MGIPGGRGCCEPVAVWMIPDTSTCGPMIYIKG